jgi:iron complex outermembrane recepter protein
VASKKSQSDEFLKPSATWTVGRRCALAAAIASALSVGPAHGQDSSSDETDEAIEEIVTTGIRSSLQSAQALKRNANTVMESITAEDLGDFPDKSIAEALQRVAGITVNRFAATSDTAHFSAEPSGVLVRGLNMVRTEFNGRDSFSANSSRGLSWGDVSPELMAGVDTYKNQMAELIEGGIAGSVNMRTRLPFDSSEQSFAATLSANYGDLSEEVTPEGSALWSNRWELDSGVELGALVNAAYSEVQTRTEGIQLYRMNRFRDVYAPDSYYYIPAIVGMRDNVYDRTREGLAAAFQFASADDKFLFSAQYNRSEYDNAWEEYVVQSSPADLSFAESVYFEIAGQDVNAYTQDSTIPIPAPGTAPFTFDNRGLFQTGVMTTGTGWRGATSEEAEGFAQNATGQPMVYPCYGNQDNNWNVAADACAPNAYLRGIDTAAITRSNNNQNMTQDLGLNLKWEISDTARANFDVQYVDSTVENYDIDVAFWTHALAEVDLTGEHPTLGLNPESPNVNMSPGGFSNPNNYYIRSIMDHVEDSEGSQIALRADFEFDLSSTWLESLKVGARYADRDQTVRWSTYNWQNVANSWTGSPQNTYWNLDRHDADTSSGFTGYPDELYVNRSFNEDFYGGGLLAPNEFVFANMGFLQDQQGFANAMGASALGLGGGIGWDPICSNTGDRADEVPGTCYTPSETSDVIEITEALYLQLNFGGSDAELFGIPVSGNVGVRYVRTNNKSTGGESYPLLGNEYFYELVDNPAYDANDPDETDPQFLRSPLPRAYENLGCYSYADAGADPNQPAPAVPNTLGCYIAEDDFNYMNGADSLSEVDVDHEHWLPSFNIKFEFNDEWLLRLAASRAMARPDIGNMKNYLGVSGTLPATGDANDPLWIKDSSGEITGARVFYNAGAQNPWLEPIIADQFDVSLEWYFADVGYASFALFYKTFDEYVQYTRGFENWTNNGVTKELDVGRPRNGEGAEIRGFELSYQTFFDFLPAPFDGFGVQANYTYIDNQGISNTGVTEVGGDATDVTGQAPDQVSVAALEGLSDNAFTVIGMYEKGSISGRLAYSWRSEYLVTAIDCCVAYPIWNDDYGSLDGSIRWQVTDNIELALSGSNLLNTETKLEQQVSAVEDGGLTLPNAWFQNDRRYTLTFRYYN